MVAAATAPNVDGMVINIGGDQHRRIDQVCAGCYRQQCRSDL
jgi:hypothetical protein